MKCLTVLNLFIFIILRFFFKYSDTVNILFSFLVPEDLSIVEREELTNIRRRKKELLDDIEVGIER